MQLPYHADRFPTPLIDRDHRFHAELYVLARPDHAGINRARNLTALAAIQRRVEGKFYERDKSVEGSTQTDVSYLLLQVDERVFQCEAEFQCVWVALDFPITHSGTGACWNGNADQ